MNKINVPSIQSVVERSGSQPIRGRWNTVEPSLLALNTSDPTRQIIDVTHIEPNPEKPLLVMQLGDPTLSGVLPTHPNILRSVIETLETGQRNGYGPSVGHLAVREELATFISSTTGKGNQVSADDIVLTSGCLHALELAIESLGGPGKNILVPKPGYPLYVTLMRPHGIQDRHYDLLMDKDWEIDLHHLESLIDERTVAIVVNNPNNPTGAVYSREHLQDILRLAERYRVPIIADEIYGDMVFGDATFYPMHTLTPKVPMLTCDSISKRYLIPGWRLGWIIIHDVDECMDKIRIAIGQLAQVTAGTCSLIQAALPSILRQTPSDFFEHNRQILSKNVDIVCAQLQNVPGVIPIRARGAMYILIGIDTKSFPDFDQKSIPDPISAFVQRLISEESLYCLPGSVFNYPNAIRLVTTHKFDNTVEACRRLKHFCIRHYRSQDKTEAQQ